MKKLGFFLVSLVLVCMVTLALAEVAIRSVNPTPRVQLVQRDNVEHLEVRRDRVVWASEYPKIEARPCLNAGDDTRRVAFVGSSIFRGSGVDGDATFTTTLQRRLAPANICVDNVSEPAFTAEQKHVLALDLLEAQHPPDLMYWEIWRNDVGAWTLIEDWGVNAIKLSRDESGAPNLLGLPASWNRALLEASQLYRYGTLTLGESGGRPSELWPPMLETELKPIVNKAREVGTTLILVVSPPLHQPFRETAGQGFAGYTPLWELATRESLRWIRLAERLIDADHVALRVDTCCHFSEDGHDVLADLFEEDIRATLMPSEAAL